MPNEVVTVSGVTPHGVTVVEEYKSGNVYDAVPYHIDVSDILQSWCRCAAVARCMYTGAGIEIPVSKIYKNGALVVRLRCM